MIVAVPPPTPAVTVVDVDPGVTTEAIVASLVLHTPPVVAEESTWVPPPHARKVPVIELTVDIVIEYIARQPPGAV